MREDVPASAFISLSRLGALVAELLIEPHKKWPFREFLPLFGETLVREVTADPPCGTSP